MNGTRSESKGIEEVERSLTDAEDPKGGGVCKIEVEFQVKLRFLKS